MKSLVTQFALPNQQDAVATPTCGGCCCCCCCCCVVTAVTSGFSLTRKLNAIYDTYEPTAQNFVSSASPVAPTQNEPPQVVAYSAMPASVAQRPSFGRLVLLYWYVIPILVATVTFGFGVLVVPVLDVFLLRLLYVKAQHGDATSTWSKAIIATLIFTAFAALEFGIWLLIVLGGLSAL